ADNAAEWQKHTLFYISVGCKNKPSVLNMGDLPCPHLDPNRRAHEAKRAANLIFQKPFVGKVQFDLAVCEQHERWRSNSGLRQIQNFYALANWNRGAIKINMLQETVHFTGGDSLAPLGCDFL